MRWRSSLAAGFGVFLAVALAALPASPAAAQRSKGAPPQAAEQSQKKKDTAKIDLDYRKALEDTKASEGPPPKLDPWQNMRGTEDAKPATKLVAKPETKPALKPKLKPKP